MLHPRARTMFAINPSANHWHGVQPGVDRCDESGFRFTAVLWERLPVSIGMPRDSPVWIIGMLTLTGIMVGLVIRYSHGHAGWIRPVNR